VKFFDADRPFGVVLSVTGVVYALLSVIASGLLELVPRLELPAECNSKFFGVFADVVVFWYDDAFPKPLLGEVRFFCTFAITPPTLTGIASKEDGVVPIGSDDVVAVAAAEDDDIVAPDGVVVAAVVAAVLTLMLL
jgi:hypothetical protein